MNPGTIKIIAILFAIIGVTLAGIGIYFWLKKYDDDDLDGDGDGNESNSLKSRIAMETKSIQNKITSNSNTSNSNSQNAITEAESNASESALVVESILKDSADNEDTLNSAISLVNSIQIAEGDVDPLVSDAVATMETQVDEANLLSEEAAITNLEIDEILAETEGSTDTIEKFVVEHLVENKQSTELSTNTHRISNSTHQNKIDGVNHLDPVPANSVGEQMSVNATEFASKQGVNDSENDKNNSIARVMNANSRKKIYETTPYKSEIRSITDSNTSLSKIELMKERFNEKKAKTTTRLQKRKQGLASTSKLNDKQKKMTERLVQKTKEREAKMAIIQEKLKNKREIRYTRQQARDKIKLIRQSKLADINAQMAKKNRNINNLNFMIRAFLSGNGNSENKHEELVKLMQELNPELLQNSGYMIESNSNSDNTFIINNQEEIVNVESFRYIN